MEKEKSILENGAAQGEGADGARRAGQPQGIRSGRQRIGGTDTPFLSPGVLLDALNDPPLEGAYICGFSVFQMLYRREKAACAREGLEEMPRLAIFSAEAKQGDPPLDAVGEDVMQLGDVLRKGLRKTDVISRCSFSQYIVMLRRATAWEGTQICHRLEEAFQEACPGAAVSVTGELLV